VLKNLFSLGELILNSHHYFLLLQGVWLPPIWQGLSAIAYILISSLIIYRLYQQNQALQKAVEEKSQLLVDTTPDLLACQQAEIEIRLLLETTQAISQTEDVESALAVMLRLICTTIGWDFGEAWIPSEDGTVLNYSPGWYGRDRSLEAFRHYSETVTFTPHLGLPGQVWASGQPQWIEDVSEALTNPTFLRSQIATNVGLKTGFGVPILANNQVLAILVFFKRTKSLEDRHLFTLVSAVAAQLGGLIERKKAEGALRIATQRLQHLLTSSPGIIYSCKPSGNYALTFVSENITTVLGYEVAEFINDATFWSSHIHPEDVDRVFAELPLLFTQGYHTHEYRFWHKDGTYRWLYNQLRLVCNETNHPIEIIGYGVDMTTRKLSEERFRLLERAIAASSNGIVISNAQLPDNPVIYVNPAFEAITGYSPSEVLGKNCRFLQRTDTQQLALTELRTALLEERECRVVLRNYRKDGTLFWNEFSIAPVRDAAGCLTHYIGIQSDITEERTAVEALTQQLRQTLLLKQVTEEIRSSLEPQQIFTTAAQKIGQLLNVDRCLIHTYIEEPEPKVPIVAEFVAPGIESLLTFDVPIKGNPHAQKMLGQDAAISSPDVEADPLLTVSKPFCRKIGLKSMLVVRTSYQGEPNGVICVHQCHDIRFWTQEEQELLESFAAQVGIAIAQAAFLQQEKQARIELDQQNLQLQQEINERLRVEAEMRQTQTFLDSIIDNIPNMFFVKDAKDLNFVRFNKAGEELVGYSKEELIGKNDYDFFSPEVADFFRAKDLEVLSSGNFLDIPEEAIQTKENGIRILHTKKMPIFTQTGVPQYLLGISEDITERKQAEIALQQQFLRERLVATIQERIRSSLNLEEVLKTAVEEVRRFLSTDRTIIFRFNSDWSGVAVVESVGKDWKAVIGTEIYDPCFGENYVVPYQQGRCRAINDIHNVGLSQCHIDLLERFQVRANLVIPILKAEETPGNALDLPFRPTQNRLWGLLIAHHCSDVRQWNASEIESLQQLCVPLAIAIQQCTLFEQAQTEIADRKRAEEALQHSNTRYQNLAANIPGMIYQFKLLPDGSMSFPYVSPGCQSIFGLTPEMAQENVNLIFDVIHPDDLSAVKESIALSAQTLEPWHDVWRTVIDGKTKWLQGDSRPEKQPDGSILWDGLVIDISDRFQAEAELRQAKEAADVANKAKSEFLAAMSHELRTPLNAILGFTQVMTRDSSLSQEQQQYLEIINRSGENLLDLINDILEMSKIEAGQTTLNQNSFDLFHLLANLETMFQLKATSKGLQIKIDYASDIPKYVQTDESKLRQVLVNLLGNAIKFTETGSITLRARAGQPAKAKMQPGEFRILFSVEDTGSGIAAQEIDKLFKAFVQTETGRKSQQGTGLGLSISRKFVQLMGGDITVSSQLGKGTIFNFDIYLNQASATNIHNSQAHSRVIGLAPNQPTYRILVVEDRWESRILLVKLLTSIGFEVLEAENGQEAVALWERWEPHLIWMDMRMPIMNGYEATQQIKSSLKGQATVIIALTASAFEEQRNLILMAGCDDFIRKPFRDVVIFEKMAQYLGVRYLYEESTAESTPVLEPSESHRQNLLSPPSIELSTINLMPAEWIVALHQAAIEADAEFILNLAQQITNTHPLLSKTLTDLVNSFQFESITDFIENHSI